MSKVKIQGNASGTGIFTIVAPATNTDRTITLPDVNAALMTSSGGTFTGNIVVTKDGSSDNRFVQITDTGASGTRWDLINRYGNTAGAFAIYDHTNSRGALEITPAGYIKTAYQPMFTANSPSTATEIGSGTGYWGFGGWTAIKNIGSHFNATNGLFTAPVSGVYYFRTVIMGYDNGSSSSPHVAFAINGSPQGGGQAYGGNDMWEHYNNANHKADTAHIIYLNANDYITVRALSSGISQPARTYFMGTLLG